MNSSRVEIVCYKCNPVIQAEPRLVCDAEYLKMVVDGLPTGQKDQLLCGQN